MAMKKDENILWKEVVKICIESEHMLPGRWPEESDRKLHAATMACDVADTIIARYIEAKAYDW